jgi:predicted nicotinamide N-methyase
MTSMPFTTPVSALGYGVETTTVRVGDFDYVIRSLSDRQQFSDPDGQAERAGISSASWPLFGLIWPAGLALAEQMSRLPAEALTGKRILEVGCGIGLSSLVLRRRGADITASDYHPLAGEFLRHNAELNHLPAIAYASAAWAGPNPDLGRFDLIIGSDLLYERDNPQLLAGFLACHANANARVIVSDPGRSHCGQFSTKMVAQGYVRSTPWPPFASGGPAPASAPVASAPVSLRGRIMNFVRALP